MAQSEFISRLSNRLFGGGLLGGPTEPSVAGAPLTPMDPARAAAGQQAWMNAAAALLRAKDDPFTSFGGALGSALQAGQQGYQGGLFNAAQREVLGSRAKAYDAQAKTLADQAAQVQAGRQRDQRILNRGVGTGASTPRALSALPTVPNTATTYAQPLPTSASVRDLSAPVTPMQKLSDRDWLLQTANLYARAGDAEKADRYLKLAQAQTPEAPDMTTLMQNATAAGFQPGTPEYQQFIRAQLDKSGQTINVNAGDSGPQVGTIPAGFAMYQRPDGGYEMRVIPGGPADIQQQQKSEKQQQQQEQKERYGDVVLQDASRALDLVSNNAFPVTGLGSLASSVPGTAAHDLSSLLSGIKSNISFDRLQQMREASPTGGALGQVSDTENRLLQAAYGSLEQSQSKEQFTYNLKRLMNIYSDIVNGPGHRPHTLEEKAALEQLPGGGAKPSGGIKFLGFD